MCLLVNEKASNPKLSDDWLRDFYDFNSDGIGVMYADNGDLIVKKALPKNSTEFVDFYRKEVEGRDCSFHLRMRTHGKISLDNCHPYEILNKDEHGISMWLMHNGVLHTGNDADKVYSDTWHYVRSYLRPMLAKLPELMFMPEFAEMVGEHIGSGNRFVVMDNLGRHVTINEETGVYWGGRWMSNEYAWSAPYNTDDKFNPDPLHHAKQVAEKPDQYVRGHGTSVWGANQHSWNGGFNKNHWADSYDKDKFAPRNIFDEDAEDELTMMELIEEKLVEMDESCLARAACMSVNQIKNFCRKFGLEAFTSIADDTIKGEIDESAFVRIMSDFRFAKESYTGLAKCEEDIKAEKKRLVENADNSGVMGADEDWLEGLEMQDGYDRARKWMM